MEYHGTYIDIDLIYTEIILFNIVVMLLTVLSLNHQDRRSIGIELRFTGFILSMWECLRLTNMYHDANAARGAFVHDLGPQHFMLCITYAIIGSGILRVGNLKGRWSVILPIAISLAPLEAGASITVKRHMDLPDEPTVIRHQHFG